MPSDLIIDFILSQTDGRPMYLQIMDHIKNKVAIKEWLPGEALPSIREMAVATTVSVITVKRAYQELESEGIIFTQAGKGSFIAQIDQLSVQLKEQEMEKHLKKAIAIAQTVGIDIEQLNTTLKQIHASEINKKTQVQENNNEHNK